MINSFKRSVVTVLVAVVAMGVALPLSAAEKSATGEGAKKGKQAKGMPFNGKIKAVDKTNKTITINREKSNTFYITSQTKIVKAGKPATFDDAVVGEQVGGQAREKDGKLQAVSLRIGPKPEAEGTAKKEKKAEEKQKKKEDK